MNNNKREDWFISYWDLPQHLREMHDQLYVALVKIRIRTYYPRHKFPVMKKILGEKEWREMACDILYKEDVARVNQFLDQYLYSEFLRVPVRK
jgi:hypothetical protein